LAIREELCIASDADFVSAIEKVGDQQVSAIEAMIRQMLANTGLDLPTQAGPEVPRTN
jgi:hypothetical protein